MELCWEIRPLAKVDGGAIEFLPRNIKHALGHCLKIGVDIHLASNLDQARILDEDRIVRVNPSRVQRSITRLAINMHTTLEKEVGIHRDAMNPGLSLDASPVWKALCIFIARTLLDSHRRRVRVTEFGT
jgi:hypothetical protein